jgi:hypothetical protein
VPANITKPYSSASGISPRPSSPRVDGGAVEEIAGLGQRGRCHVVLGDQGDDYVPLMPPAKNRSEGTKLGESTPTARHALRKNATVGTRRLVMRSPSFRSGAS